jgi:hypothetical protein
MAGMSQETFKNPSTHSMERRRQDHATILPRRPLFIDAGIPAKQRLSPLVQRQIKVPCFHLSVSLQYPMLTFADLLFARRTIR